MNAIVTPLPVNRKSALSLNGVGIIEQLSHCFTIYKEKDYEITIKDLEISELKKQIMQISSFKTIDNKIINKQ